MLFQKLNKESLRKVRPLLRSKLPKSAMVLNIFDMTLSGKYPEDDSVQIYGDSGVQDADNLFLCVVIKPRPKDQDIEFSVVYAPETLNEEAVKAFVELHDWSQVLTFAAVPLHFVKCLRKVAQEKGGNLSGAGEEEQATVYDMYLPVERALELNIERADLKEEFKLDKLLPLHASKINSHWKYGSKGHEQSIAEDIKSFRAAGIFKRNSEMEAVVGSSGENLVSWVILTRTGTLNALHTLEEYRGRGLGSWTMQAASKWLAAEEDLIPVCEIENYNKESKRLVEKIGFEIIQEVRWMQYKPVTEAKPV